MLQIWVGGTVQGYLVYLTHSNRERKGGAQGGEEWMEEFDPALGKRKCLDSETAFVTVSESWGRGRIGGFCVDLSPNPMLVTGGQPHQLSLLGCLQISGSS